jgi:hypothetical protein
MNTDTSRKPIKLSHNLNGDFFMWLWAKYVRSVNDQKHCTASLRGPYSKRLSGHNPHLSIQRKLVLDEVPSNEFKAIYICGVAKKGYSRKKNYPFNLHAAILPTDGAKDVFAFNGWELGAKNGIFMQIPNEDDLPKQYRSLPSEYTTCRIFRWAVCSAHKFTEIEVS